MVDSIVIGDLIGFIKAIEPHLKKDWTIDKYY